MSLRDIREMLRDLKERDHSSMTEAQFRAEIEAILRALQDYEADENNDQPRLDGI